MDIQISAMQAVNVLDICFAFLPPMDNHAKAEKSATICQRWKSERDYTSSLKENADGICFRLI
ncbi:hypothetical protein DC094_10925 [Pelagibaculum spongiae]|uniref:Uncharacterized protein n=1 Tax=Pelagibaculum spongiae TaxID=2080658 RepID=A0A2V1GUZ5_9GAMM|nr:hypothetical protein DC094_10925 [Pelagibaculum spongiae]